MINFSFNFFDSEYIIINGVKVQTLNSIKQLKENLGRIKDKKDIKLINKRLKKNI